MTEPLSILSARNCGEIRYAVVTEFTGDLSRVLAKVGLLDEPTLLEEVDRGSAASLLKSLLWKDMAYSIELMPERQAEAIANDLIAQFGGTESRYFSNGNRATSNSWAPLTDSTFDSGLLIECVRGKYFCIWFQDED